MADNCSRALKGVCGCNTRRVIAFFAIVCLFAAAPAAKAVSGPNAPQYPRPDHAHKAFGEYTERRADMVEQQIRQRDINDPNVLRAMLTVPRHFFVRPSDLGYAYTDQPLPIGLGQTISQPYIVAFMTEALHLRPDSKVLEIGTGSGYQAAVCAEITAEVYTIEIVSELAESAKKRLEGLGYRNVSVRAGDGYFGWPEKGPFDAVIVTAAAPQVPPRLIQQVAPGGRLIMPLGDVGRIQQLLLIDKDKQGNAKTTYLLPVSFVPMTGQIREEKTKPDK